MIPKNDDDSNPMHSIGHGRGDDTAEEHQSRRKTAAYSFVDPQRGNNKMETTQPMRAIDPTQPMEAVETLSVRTIVSSLIERNLQAWKALPERIRDKMLEHPQEFQFIPNKYAKSSSPGIPLDRDFPYCILYNGTVWAYKDNAVLWVIQDIVR